MAVEVISPDTRKKVDELFLYWLSEPSTQEMLRNELAKVCGLQQKQHTSSEFVTTTSSATATPSSNSGCASVGVAKKPTHRPSSSNSIHTTTSPTPPLNRSPKSPRGTGGKQQPGKTKQHAEREGEDVVNDLDDGGSDLGCALQESKPQQQNGGAGIAARQQSLSEGGTSSLRLPPPPPPATLEVIPLFYFPNGRPKTGENMEQRMKEVEAIFHRYPRQELPRKDFHAVLKVFCHIIQYVNVFC